jgi:hypothetical protein
LRERGKECPKVAAIVPIATSEVAVGTTAATLNL